MTSDFNGEQSMANRSRDWFAQDEKDIELAVLAQGNGNHDWACFACQQAAEKAVKALHLHHGQEARGHVVARLLRELPATPPSELRWPDRDTVDRAARPFIERGRNWDVTGLPVPAQILVYTQQEWDEVVARGGRFGRVMATEVVWVIG